jgi:hypothetical protein
VWMIIEFIFVFRVTKLKSLVGECLDRLYKIVVDAQEKKEK